MRLFLNTMGYVGGRAGDDTSALSFLLDAVLLRIIEKVVNKALT